MHVCSTHVQLKVWNFYSSAYLELSCPVDFHQKTACMLNYHVIPITNQHADCLLHACT